MNMIGLVTLVLLAPAAWSKTWTVGKSNTPCPTADYDTISAAVSAASPGDTIQVCPALYPEQLTIMKPVTIVGVGQQNVGRVLIQPTALQTTTLQTSGGTSWAAVITVMNTANVTLRNIAVDASNNAVSGCTPALLAGIHYYNASGTVDSVSTSGAQLAKPLSCTKLFPGNGFGVLADQDAAATGAFAITVSNSSIHDFTRDGILVMGAGEHAIIESSVITGVGPSTGGNQFGVFLANGATGRIAGNMISEGTCGSLALSDCVTARSEGVVLRSVGSGVVVEANIITNVQAGVFVNGATNALVRWNFINNVDALNGIHIQSSTAGTYVGNRIMHVGPITADTSSNESGCGINDVSGTGSATNSILGNWINDAYCGVGYVTGDQVQENIFLNTLYEMLNGDDYPSTFPPPVEPGQE